MDTFFASNPGLSSRVANHIDFPDYSPEELMQIAEMMLARLNYRFTATARKAFAEYVELRMSQPNFANARSIRNALDRARLRQATRLFERGGTVSSDDLKDLDEPDIRRSRVFASAATV
jgi:hypothetical protein